MLPTLVGLSLCTGVGAALFGQAVLAPQRCNVLPLIHTSNASLRNEMIHTLARRFEMWDAATLNGTRAFTFDTLENGRFKLQHRGWFELDAVACNASKVADGFDQPPGGRCFESCDATIRGTVFLHNMYHTEHYAHFITDHLPLLYTAATTLRQNGYAFRPVFHRNPWKQQWLHFLDPALFKGTHWVNRSQTFCVNGTIVTANPPIGGVYAMKHPDVLRHLWARLHTVHFQPHFSREKETVVYYTRSGKETYHGRQFAPEFDKQVISTIADALREYGRHERLVVFTGLDNGRIMSPEKQFRLFSTATVVIGMHGTGMTNNLFLPSRLPCERRPHIVEIICGPQLKNFTGHQEGCGELLRSQYSEFGGAPWANYHFIPISPESTPTRFYMDLGDLRDALRSIWEPEHFTKLIAELPATRLA